jgi:hypothetical protein
VRKRFILHEVGRKPELKLSVLEKKKKRKNQREEGKKSTKLNWVQRKRNGGGEKKVGGKKVLTIMGEHAHDDSPDFLHGDEYFPR